MKTLCTICARGGSQGVKNKNIINLRGKPLIAHTILQAKRSGLFSVIVVSSDPPQILAVAEEWGADYLINRPIEMASSTAAKLPAIQHAVLETERITSASFDVIVDLDVTSPLRAVDDIHNAHDLLVNNNNALNLVTASLARRSPYFNMLEVSGDGFAQLAKLPENPVVRRQDAPLCYDMNSSIYIWKREELLQCQRVITNRTLLYVMPEERSIDIDSTMDLQLVRLLAKSREDMN
ncbi:MAG: flagellar modification protein B [Gammaproteobacteria bacterium RIFCSPHIGHO2_12_FULL_37_14]|nr:MAG: flagellar modification protein B [Gammaproteobacteria bacterium RIFCSPHIGHO2_12_FULL_37_14]